MFLDAIVVRHAGFVEQGVELGRGKGGQRLNGVRGGRTGGDVTRFRGGGGGGRGYKGTSHVEGHRGGGRGRGRMLRPSVWGERGGGRGGDPDASRVAGCRGLES